MHVNTLYRCAIFFGKTQYNHISSNTWIETHSYGYMRASLSTDMAHTTDWITSLIHGLNSGKHKDSWWVKDMNLDKHVIDGGGNK